MKAGPKSMHLPPVGSGQFVSHCHSKQGYGSQPGYEASKPTGKFEAPFCNIVSPAIQHHAIWRKHPVPTSSSGGKEKAGPYIQHSKFVIEDAQGGTYLGELMRLGIF